MAAAALLFFASPLAQAMQLQVGAVAEAIAAEGVGEGPQVAVRATEASQEASPAAAERRREGCRKGPGSAYVVMFMFAGRRDRLSVLTTYLDRLIATCELDEVHLWNGTRNVEDLDWLTTTLAGRDGYTVFLPIDHKVPGRKQTYEFYSSNGTRGPLRAVGKEVGLRFVPEWEGATEDNTLIIKLDDDVVFVDTDHFTCFVNYALTSETFIVHANVVNNAVAAYYQVLAHPDLRDRFPLLVDYPVARGKAASVAENDGAAGYLWENGTMAIDLHRCFLEDPARFSGRGPDGEACIVYRPPGLAPGQGQGRESINFYGARRQRWDLVTAFARQGRSDELPLTVTATKHPGISECIYAPFVVSHLSFANQERNNPSLAGTVLPWYENLATRRAVEWAAQGPPPDRSLPGGAAVC